MSAALGPLARYEQLVHGSDYLADPAQARLAAALDEVWQGLVGQGARGGLRRLLASRSESVRGLYAWGGVGRGKTWLMDLFFDSLPLTAKRRLHFHRFMAAVHDELGARPGSSDPLPDIARSWSRQFRVLCFDEFYVSDIADAMLLAGLLEALFADGVTLVATSNVAPVDLYRDGLQRARFLPAIDLIERHCRVLEVTGEIDYRLRILERARTWHQPLDAAAESALEGAYERVADGCDLPRELVIRGRTFTARRRGDGVIWFDFDELCRKPRGSGDFIALARSYNTVFLSGVPVMGPDEDDPARRFISLVDEFYDRNVRLLVSAAARPDDLYNGRRLAFEYRRTASRLAEMQTHDYLARPHLA